MGLALGGLLFLDLGTRVAMPRIDGRVLAEWFNGGHGGWLLGLYDRLTAGGLSHGGWLALGIMPYVSARILMRLAGLQHRIRATRVLTLVLAATQSYGFARWAEHVPGAVATPGDAFVRATVVTLTAGTLVLMWMHEKLTGRGTASPDARGASPQLNEGLPQAQPIARPENVSQPHRPVPTPV